MCIYYYITCAIGPFIIFRTHPSSILGSGDNATTYPIAVLNTYNIAAKLLLNLSGDVRLTPFRIDFHINPHKNPSAIRIFFAFKLDIVSFITPINKAGITLIDKYFACSNILLASNLTTFNDLLNSFSK